MKLNLFDVPPGEVVGLKGKLLDRRMEMIEEVDQDGWHGEFYYSTTPDPVAVAWAEDFADLFKERDLPSNTNYYAAFLFSRGSSHFVLSYGKSHFYIRPFCNYDFGVELAKRIADESDVKQTASKRFQGTRKKDIRSFAANTRLDVESGESVDYIQAAVIDSKREAFGRAGKFGTSALLAPEIGSSDIGQFLTLLQAEMSLPARFKLPRTIVITDDVETDRYNNLLIDELSAPVGTTDFAQNSYDLYGVDFIFSNHGSFRLRCPGYPEAILDDLSMRELKEYIFTNNIARSDILRIKVVHEHEDRPKYSQEIKQELDYIADEDRVVLTHGRWMLFNQDYLEFLDEYLESIRVEEVEPEFAEISVTETVFNQSERLRELGYETADNNFAIFQTRSRTPIEAWDLKKGECVYAVKFGTAQKLGYVCDQASGVLELLRNRAGVKQVPKFRQYCLWLGYKSKANLEKVSQSGSIILKQKIEAWARKAHEVGVEPVIKISRRL